MKDLFAEAMKLREADRRKARPASDQAVRQAMILLDTNHLSVLTDRQAADHANLVRRLESAGEPLAIPIVAAEEQCKGWLAKLGRTREVHQQITPYQRLAEFFDFLAEWDIVPLREAAVDRFAELRRQKSKCCRANGPSSFILMRSTTSRSDISHIA